VTGERRGEERIAGGVMERHAGRCEECSGVKDFVL